MRVTNPNNLPQPYVDAVSQMREAQRGRISITELISPPQQRSLMLQMADEIEVTADSRIDLFFGNAVHEYLARFAGADALAEETMQYVVDGWTVHGTPDYVDWFGVEDGTLTDWKTTRVRALQYDRPEWEQQVNLYRWLLYVNGYPVERLVVKAFLKDWDRAQLREPSYPRAPICHLDIPVWDIPIAHAFLKERLRLHKQAARGFYPACTPEERWQRDTWAVTKVGNTRATRVFRSLAEAVQFAESVTEHPRRWQDWYTVEERKGDPVRCLSFCPVADYCDQFAEERHAVQEAAMV